jgi:hypothetical protein
MFSFLVLYSTRGIKVIIKIDSKKAHHLPLIFTGYPGAPTLEGFTYREEEELAPGKMYFLKIEIDPFLVNRK